MMCWHKWTKWEKYNQAGKVQTQPFSKEMIPFSERRQKRYCMKCGWHQDKLIKSE